jgi:hypothetical protein
VTACANSLSRYGKAPRHLAEGVEFASSMNNGYNDFLTALDRSLIRMRGMDALAIASLVVAISTKTRAG